MSEEILDKILTKSKKYGIRKLFLFGSALESDSYKDIDLACSGLTGFNIFRFAGELENEIEMNVDIVNIDKESAFVNLIKPNMKLIDEG
jgi:predicted nucleotidyltransferase